MSKSILCLLINLLSLAYTIIDEEFVQNINSQQNQWIATADNKFSRMSESDLKQYLGVTLDIPEDINSLESVNYKNTLEYMQLPEQFDSRKKWGRWIHPIRSQGKCGSCWAFGSSGVLSDRIAIASQGVINIVLSPQYQVSCDTNNLGCDGGHFIRTWKNLVYNGTTIEYCLPYTSGDTGEAEQCPKICKDKSSIQLYKAKNIRIFDNVESAKLDILVNGPIYTGYSVYSDFMAYKSGIYFKTQESKYLGGHAVRVVGWGVTNQIKYWIVANSWGSDWGENGFFRIQEEECDFEYKLIAADAVV